MPHRLSGKGIAMTTRMLAAIALGLLMLAGCSQQASGPSAEHAALGQKFLLAEEPAGAVGIIDFRESTAEAEAPEAADVALVGRIGGGKLTW